jgi:hypothetical protein
MALELMLVRVERYGHLDLGGVWMVSVVAIDTPTEARCGKEFCLVVSRHQALLTASHNLALKQDRLQAFYLLWNQSRRGGWDLQNAARETRKAA